VTQADIDAWSKNPLLAFELGMRLAFERWEVLRIAIEMGWTRDGIEKRDALCDAVIKMFIEQKGEVDPDELEDFLAQRVLDDFNTDAQDGSVERTAKLARVLWQDCQKKDFTGLKKMVEAAARIRGRPVQLLRQTADGRAEPVLAPVAEDEEGKNDEGDEGEDEEDEGTGAGVEGKRLPPAGKKPRAPAPAPSIAASGAALDGAGANAGPSTSSATASKSRKKRNKKKKKNGVGVVDICELSAAMVSTTISDSAAATPSEGAGTDSATASSAFTDGPSGAQPAADDDRWEVVTRKSKRR